MPEDESAKGPSHSESGPETRTTETLDVDEPYVPGFLDSIRDYFLGEDPTFAVAVVPCCFLSMLLFTRHPFKTNFIFDEQEALLANPYVRSVADPVSKLHWLDAFRRDFWGLPPDRSIGSYRPIPDVIWRVLWGIGARDQSPFLHHWVNVLLHGINGAVLTLIAFKLTKDRLTSWLCGGIFVACAVLTEAVSGVVGIADVLGALGALLALASLTLPLTWMPLAVFGATLFGLFSKESALVCVPLVPFVGLMVSQITHPRAPMRWIRMGAAALASVAAFVLYVEARKHLFPAPIQSDLSTEANRHKPAIARVLASMLRWYAQPALPRDPLNNPLIDAAGPNRVAGALRIYLRGLSQIVFPWTLSGDYSAPQEPAPRTLIFPESVLGALFAILPLALGPILGLFGWLDERKRPRSSERDLPDLCPVVGAALVWIVVSYFPVSNIPVLLPTVRAERFWYFPAIATSLLLGIAFRSIFAWSRPVGVQSAAIGLFIVFFAFQSFAARRHASDYTNDLTFWDATRHAVPRSAKAHLNYSVMQGARGNLDVRLESNRTALALAPDWPMANVYMGDTLCRLHHTSEAWPYYSRGFDLAPNDVSLVALGVQCLWDEKALEEDSATRAELETLASEHPGSWVEYLVHDTLENGADQKGVDPKYRPRGYNEGPKSE
jgi:hypothetical protein